MSLSGTARLVYESAGYTPNYVTPRGYNTCVRDALRGTIEHLTGKSSRCAEEYIESLRIFNWEDENFK